MFKSSKVWHILTIFMLLAFFADVVQIIWHRRREDMNGSTILLCSVAVIVFFFIGWFMGRRKLELIYEEIDRREKALKKATSEDLPATFQLEPSAARALERVRRYFELVSIHDLIDSALRLQFRIVNAFYEGAVVTVVLEWPEGETTEFDPVDYITPGYRSEEADEGDKEE